MRLIKLEIIEDEPYICTTSIANNVQNTHEAVIKLVRKYKSDFEAFGGIRFEIEPFDTEGGIQKREVAYLNEAQSTLLITYMKNNETVRKFKIALVKAFMQMKQRLSGSSSAADVSQLVSAVRELSTQVSILSEQNQTMMRRIISKERPPTPMELLQKAAKTKAYVKFTNEVISILKRYPQGIIQKDLLALTGRPEDNKAGRQYLAEGMGKLWTFEKGQKNATIYFLLEDVEEIETLEEIEA